MAMAPEVAAALSAWGVHAGIAEAAVRLGDTGPHALTAEAAPGDPRQQVALDASPHRPALGVPKCLGQRVEGSEVDDRFPAAGEDLVTVAAHAGDAFSTEEPAEDRRSPIVSRSRPDSLGVPALDDGGEGGAVEEPTGCLPQPLRLILVHAAIAVVAEAPAPPGGRHARAGEVAVRSPDPVGDGVRFELGECPGEMEGELDAAAGQPPDRPLEGENTPGQTIELPHQEHVEGP